MLRLALGSRHSEVLPNHSLERTSKGRPAFTALPLSVPAGPPFWSAQLKRWSQIVSTPWEPSMREEVTLEEKTSAYLFGGQLVISFRGSGGRLGTTLVSLQVGARGLSNESFELDVGGLRRFDLKSGRLLYELRVLSWLPLKSVTLAVDQINDQELINEIKGRSFWQAGGWPVQAFCALSPGRAAVQRPWPNPSAKGTSPQAGHPLRRTFGPG
jgi:hypothetical protein